MTSQMREFCYSYDYSLTCIAVGPITVANRARNFKSSILNLRDY